MKVLLSERFPYKAGDVARHVRRAAEDIWVWFNEGLFGETCYKGRRKHCLRFSLGAFKLAEAIDQVKRNRNPRPYRRRGSRLWHDGEEPSGWRPTVHIRGEQCG